MDAWGVLANVGIFTAPGTQPVYTAIDVMLLGVGGAPNPNLPQEAAVRTRIEGFTTDPTSFIDLFATDVDACTGAQTLRYYATIGVDNIDRCSAGGGGVPTPRRRSCRRRACSRRSTRTGSTRTGRRGTVGLPNGLLAGYYTAPNFEFIFPENLGIGQPPVPNNFGDFPFLSSGSGPYPAPARALGILGQLAPWPGAVAPPAPVLHRTARPRSRPSPTRGSTSRCGRVPLVTLDGGNSRDTTQPTAAAAHATCGSRPRAPRASQLFGAGHRVRRRSAPPGTPATLTFNADGEQRPGCRRARRVERRGFERPDADRHRDDHDRGLPHPPRRGST